MISRNTLMDLLTIVLLVGMQILLFNRLAIRGQYIPVVYPVFVMFYPFYRNRYTYLFLSFLLGLLIDSIFGTWGINAFATCTIAYFRKLIFRIFIHNDIGNFSFQTVRWVQFSLFIIINVFTHQLLVQYMELFKLSRILEVFFNILATTIISSVFIFLYALIFKIKQKV